MKTFTDPHQDSICQAQGCLVVCENYEMTKLNGSAYQELGVEHKKDAWGSGKKERQPGVPSTFDPPEGAPGWAIKGLPYKYCKLGL